MEHLWTPWRNDYVGKSRENLDDLFTRIAQSPNDEENFLLFRGKSWFVLLNAFPYNAGHLMIIPYRATPNLEDFSPEEQLEMMALLLRMKTAVTQAFRPHGFNIGINLGSAAGAGISKHLHIHLVPRWEHDANFMTTTADTRIHPSDLAEVYRRLKAVLSES